MPTGGHLCGENRKLKRCVGDPRTQARARYQRWGSARQTHLTAADGQEDLTRTAAGPLMRFQPVAVLPQR